MLQQFDKQRSRGTQGFGIFDGLKMNMVHETKENKILKWLVKYDSPLLLMHHRFPTSTVNVKQAAHPFSTKQHFGDNQYIMVHNGIITNDDELYVKHAKLGIRYHSLLDDLSFNDSEALLWDFALLMEGKQKELTAQGAQAFICLKLVKGKLEKMYFGRNHNPLNMLRTKEGISLSSEGEGESILSDTLYTWNYDLRRLTTRPLEIKRTVYVTSSYTRPYEYNPSYDHTYKGSGTQWGAWGKYDDDYDDERRYIPPTPKGYDEEDELRLEYDEKLHLYLPAEAGLTFEEQELLDAGVELPTVAEIEGTMSAYMAGANGYFEEAYWAMESDYQDLEELPYSFANKREMILLEKAISLLDKDEEYVTPDSISSLWIRGDNDVAVA